MNESYTWFTFHPQSTNGMSTNYTRLPFMYQQRFLRKPRHPCQCIYLNAIVSKINAIVSKINAITTLHPSFPFLSTRRIIKYSFTIWAVLRPVWRVEHMNIYIVGESPANWLYPASCACSHPRIGGMGFSLYNMFKAGLLLTNAVAILHPKVRTNMIVDCFHLLFTSWY